MRRQVCLLGRANAPPLSEPRHVQQTGRVHAPSTPARPPALHGPPRVRPPRQLRRPIGHRSRSPPRTCGVRRFGVVRAGLAHPHFRQTSGAEIVSKPTKAGENSQIEPSCALGASPGEAPPPGGAPAAATRWRPSVRLGRGPPCSTFRSSRRADRAMSISTPSGCRPLPTATPAT